MKVLFSAALMPCMLPVAVFCGVSLTLQTRPSCISVWMCILCVSPIGVKKVVTENQNMWGMFTSESFTPLLEFDFLGTDAWEALGRGAAEVAALGPGDKLELRTKQVEGPGGGGQ